jgi:glycosyltransferase involved in cell wall biosynthesis
LRLSEGSWVFNRYNWEIVEMPKISVVMSVYNEERYLGEAIDSILNQTFKDFEFIIVNDGSSDKTKSILQAYDDSKIIILDNLKRIGRAAARNKAIKISKGEYIAIMDADDISLPERFKKESEYLNNHENVALVGSSCYVIDEDGRTLRLNDVLRTNEEIQRRLPRRNCFCHGTVMVRKKCLVDVGCYREEFEGAEDYDLYLRLGELFELRNLGDPLYKWRQNPKSFSGAEPIKLDKFAVFAQELARERKMKGKDKLDYLDRSQIVKMLPRLTLKDKIEQKYLMPKQWYKQFRDFRKNNNYSLLKLMVLCLRKLLNPEKIEDRCLR